MTLPFIGYSSNIWAAVANTLTYYLDQIDDNTVPADAISLTDAVFETLLNGLQAINANTLVQTWRGEAINLQAIQALPISISADDAAILNNRTAAFLAAPEALAPLLPQPPFPPPAQSVAKGSALIPDMDLLGFYQGFNFETPPVGTTMSNMIANAANVSDAFGRIATAIQILQGAQLTSAYDVATRQQQVSAVAAGILADLTASPLSALNSVTQTWNEVVTLPAMSMDAALLGTIPFSYQAQQNGVIRNTILVVAAQLALFILTLRKPLLSQISLATVRVGDNLMDIANRNLGDYEQWRQIAIANGLQPPWIGPNAIPVSGVAGWGQQILMPTPGTSGSSAGVAPSYQFNFLGIDLYIGPINGDMPTWSGDFQTISGYKNLAWAVGRRLQTTLGTLIYHPDYGSRIPPEVGQIQNLDTAELITSYAVSAILSDPRVQAVLSASSRLLPNGLVAFQGQVQPAGFGTSTGINEVIGPR